MSENLPPQIPPQNKNKTTFIVIIAVLGVLMLCCGGAFIFTAASNLNTTSHRLYKYPSPSTTWTPYVGPKETPTSTKTFNINDSVKVETREGTFSMKLSDVKMVSDTFDKNKKYIALLVEIEALTGVVSYNPLDFNLRDVDGTEYGTLSGLFADAEPHLGSSNTLQPGQKARGYIAFGAPESVIKTGTLEYGTFAGSAGYWKLG